MNQNNDPFADEAHEVFRFLPATVAAFVLPGLIYWAGMKFWLGERFSPQVRPAEFPPDKLVQSNI